MGYTKAALLLAITLLVIKLYQHFKGRRENLTGPARLQELTEKWCHTRVPGRRERLEAKIYAIDPNWSPPPECS
jgi:hypothetical protein